MPKQFEQEKKVAERSKKSKEQFKNNPNDSHYSSKEATNREQLDSATTLFRTMSKAITGTFMEIQKKLEK